MFNNLFCLFIYRRNIENDASDSSSIATCVFVTAVWFLSSRCLAAIGGFLSNRCLATKGDTVSLIRHGPHWKRRVQQFLYYCVCIRYCSNVSAEPLPNNGRGIFTKPSSCLATMEGFLPRRYVATIGEGIRVHTQTAMWSHKPTLFFQNSKVG
jgi:hypothetical protein